MKYDGIAGKVAIVTGAGGGIGEAYARALAAQGAKVAIAELAKDRGEAVAEAIDWSSRGAAAVSAGAGAPPPPSAR